MHFLFAAVTLATCLLGEAKVDPYTVKVDYGALINSGIKERKDLCEAAEKERNCIKSNSPAAIPGCEADHLVFDTFACCYVCPKLSRDTCGGWLYKHGRCENGYHCLHEILDSSDFIRNMGPDGRQDAPTGKCIPDDARLACKAKNCCERTKSNKTLSCGSDGNWYPNKCFLYKANCFRSMDGATGTPPITMIKKNTTNVCGPRPTAEALCSSRSIAACLTTFSEKSDPIKLYYSSADKPACATRPSSIINPDTVTAKTPTSSPVAPEGA